MLQSIFLGLSKIERQALRFNQYNVENLNNQIKNNLKIKPNIYCKGSEYSNFSNDISGQIKNEIRAVKSVGGKIKFTNEATYSSSKIYNFTVLL